MKLTKIEKLKEAEVFAKQLFLEIEKRELVQANKTEKELNQEVYNLAFEMFGIKKYWHKRIVRAGENTLLPYRHNPENLTIQADDILFFDFGPVFENWEADFGRTYVLGQDPQKLTLQADLEKLWLEGQKYYLENRKEIKGSDLYAFTTDLAKKYGWDYGNEHAGHLIGEFPHEQVQGEQVENYIHPKNLKKMSEPDNNGLERFWIYEIHLVDLQSKFGGFFEQLLDI